MGEFWLVLARSFCWRCASLMRSQVTADDQVKAYVKKIMSQLKEWMYGGKISKLVVVITSKETGEHVERWQFDVSCLSPYQDLTNFGRFKYSANLSRAGHLRKP